MQYFAGSALPGSGKRSKTLPLGRLGDFLGLVLHPGTFNVTLLEPPPLAALASWEMPPGYRLWPCRVASMQMVMDGVTGFLGWVVRVDGETYPDCFVEILSARNLRETLKMDEYSSYPVEIALELEDEV